MHVFPVLLLIYSTYLCFELAFGWRFNEPTGPGSICVFLCVHDAWALKAVLLFSLFNLFYICTFHALFFIFVRNEFSSCCPSICSFSFWFSFKLLNSSRYLSRRKLQTCRTTCYIMILLYLYMHIFCILYANKCSA
jgi:hypothetical protein